MLCTILVYPITYFLVEHNDIPQSSAFFAAYLLTIRIFCVILYREDKSRELTVQRGIGRCKISGETRGYHLAEENGGSHIGSYKLYKMK